MYILSYIRLPVLKQCKFFWGRLGVRPCRHCCKGNERFQWEMLFFGVWQLRNLLTDFQNILLSWLRRRPHPACKCWGQSVQRGRVCACVKLLPSGVYFFLSFFKVPCASLQVGPLDRSTPLTAQTTRPVGIHIPYVVWIIKINIFPICYPKMWKIALRPMATPKSYNSGTFEDTCMLFGPNWVLRVGQSNGVL